MNKEINYLKEHLYEIYKYKKSQKDLTYDMDLELLLRTCKALDFIQQENQQLKKQLNCKEYFSSTMPEDTEFVILTKNNYDRQQKDLALENQQLKKQKDDVVEYIKNNATSNYFDKDKNMFRREIDLLRMLGEIDVED